MLPELLHPSADAIKNVSTTDAAAALQGKASGVQVLTNSGVPDRLQPSVYAVTSSNSGNIGPLLIVDGLKVDNIQYPDPSMIESIEILKGCCFCSYLWCPGR